MQDNGVVLDTNIWISYFIQNNNEQFVKFILSNDIKLYRSNSLTRELKDVIMRPKVLKRLKLPVEEYIALYKEFTTFVNAQSIFTGCPDKNDNFLFDLAIQSKAKYLVTGDKVVLTTGVKPPLQVITLADFKKIIS